MGQSPAICCQTRDCCTVEATSSTLDVTSAFGFSEGGHATNYPSQYDKSLDNMISEDARQQEKARLKMLVRTFTSTAIRGVHCSRVDLKTGKLDLAEYSLDRFLRVFSVRPIEAPNGARPETLEVSRIVEVMHGLDLPQDIELPASLGDTMRQRLVVLRYEGLGQLQDLALLEADTQDCENFLTCMNILRLYSEVSEPAAPQ
eukprot:TRINITY_DN4341_c0_g1_i1.p1 TRINITY_DN4341_c0_g1~~TRINITY_DN4341_c0_g1_i1.p1  ORF type:complete len:202 (+),score=33.71 TRINITY_DN4341_c0_g1_i1:136-741(+)